MSNRDEIQKATEIMRAARLLLSRSRLIEELTNLDDVQGLALDAETAQLIIKEMKYAREVINSTMLRVWKERAPGIPTPSFQYETVSTVCPECQNGHVKPSRE